jgi:hypothetical protein
MNSRQCFIDAQNIETHYFIEGKLAINAPIRISHNKLISYLKQKFYEGSNSFDLVLVTDDGDFLPLLEFFEKRNCQTIIVGTKYAIGGMSRKLHFDTNKKLRNMHFLDDLNIFVNKT